MKASASMSGTSRLYLMAAVAIVAIGILYTSMQSNEIFASEQSLLGGRVTSMSGESMAGIPVRAHRDNSNITVTVYTNSAGEYSFPGWSDVRPGMYSVAVEMAEFQPLKHKGVRLTVGRPAKIDFEVNSRKPPVEMLRTTDILRGLPGTEEQKFMFSQCSNCHSLAWPNFS